MGALSGPVVVLGGSGFIGTRLTGLLREQGIPVRIGDLRQSEAFPDLWTECDVRQQESLSEVVRGATAIINLAAEHRDDVRPISRYHEVNVGGAEQVCQAARQAGIGKIIFTSSVAVYGFQPRPVDEEGPFEPFNDYGRTKLEAEGVYQGWAAEDPARSLVIVRPTVVFGEGNRGNVYNLLHQIAAGRFMMVGSGGNVKSMAYVGNIAAFVAHTLGLGRGVHILNYVDGPDKNTRDLVALVWQSLGKAGRPRHIPLPVAMLGGHVLDFVARVTGRNFPVSAIRVRKFCESTQFRAERVATTGFAPPYSLSEGLRRTIQFEFPQGVSQAATDALPLPPG
ncbi:MAG: NAD-dependent epimerase/dehydratase family protein [Acidobacteriaceae bacterium]